MKQRAEYADTRLRRSCIYCGTGRSTKDHAPSRVFLVSPYPENLPIVPACKPCNNSFSLDEEYVAALIECTLCGSAAPLDLNRPKIREILGRSPGLAARLTAAREHTAAGIRFSFETDRVRKIVTKLARGHAAYELSEYGLDEADLVAFTPLLALTDAQRMNFETPPSSSIWPEVGCRAMMTIAETACLSSTSSPWLIVQPGRYRFLATVASGTVVRIVISEYLACEVIWEAN